MPGKVFFSDSWDNVFILLHVHVTGGHVFMLHSFVYVRSRSGHILLLLSVFICVPHITRVMFLCYSICTYYKGSCSYVTVFVHITRVMFLCYSICAYYKGHVLMLQYLCILQGVMFLCYSICTYYKGSCSYVTVFVHITKGHVLMLQYLCILQRVMFLCYSRLYMLQGAMAQQEWRIPDILHRFLNYVIQHMAHPYKNVRDRLGRSVLYRHTVSMYAVVYMLKNTYQSVYYHSGPCLYLIIQSFILSCQPRWLSGLMRSRVHSL